MTSNQTAIFRENRRPRGYGGDVTLNGMALTGQPQFFPRGQGQHIVGLGGECVAQIPVPTPAWLYMEAYRRLVGNNNLPRLQFITTSLNFSTYNARAVPSAREMTNAWMNVQGRFHPSNLTWHVPAGGNGNGFCDYTMAPLMDGYNSGPDDAANISTLPSEGFTMPPHLTFQGVVQGSGLQVLRPGILDDEAAKLSALLNFSNLINPVGCSTGRGQKEKN